MEDVIRKHALKNAFDYGKADVGAVVGRVVAEVPEAKKDMKKTMATIKKIVGEINKMKKNEVGKALEKYSFEKKKEEERKITLPNAVRGKVVTRFPPEPSGFPHIGHAKAAFLDFEGARAYEGKFILRFDDTNPEKEEQKFADAIKEGLGWLGITWDEELYASDFMPKIYEHAEKLIEKGRAYVCTCSQEEMKKARAEGKGCACREKKPASGVKEWKEMLKGKLREGEAVVRFKGDVGSLNTVMRDPTILRIIEAPHYRQKNKYRVWPNYDFEVSILDSVTGVTHAMRTKEYELRDELYNALLDAMGLRKPVIVEFSRLAIKDAPIGKRLLRPLIEENKVLGWDDPRLPTLAGLKRRGIRPEAIKKFVLSFGIGKAESEPTWDALLSENRKILDPVSERYYFVPSPLKLKVKNAPKMSAHLRKHPTADLGERVMEVGNTFYIPKSDAQALARGEVFRLKDLYNVKFLREGEQLEGEYAGGELKEGKKLQWVSEENYLECEVLVPGDVLVDDRFNETSLRIDEGYCERACGSLGVGAIIQFERYGFCRLDWKGKNKLRFILTNP
ncbi:MAG: glutamate--tRNA ligase [Candidatus Micrarchaeota archaeon]